MQARKCALMTTSVPKKVSTCIHISSYGMPNVTLGEKVSVKLDFK